MPSKKRSQPEHNTPPHKDTGKKNKPSDNVPKEVEQEEYFCDRCTEAVDDLVQCERCEMWLCAGCEKMSPEVINFIGEYNEFRVHWFCKICDKNAINAAKSYSQMTNPLTKEITSCLNDTLVKSLNSIIEDVTKAVDKIQTSLLKSLEDKVVPSKVDSSNSAVSPISSESVASLTTSLFNEQKEREKRRMNLVLHNMPESTASEGAARKKDDILKVTSVLKDSLKIKPTINNAVRIGKKGSDKPRLLKITIGSTEEKATILRNKFKMRDESNPDYIRKIFITPDYTPLEQRKNKALRQQLAEMNKEGNTYRIKNGEIVRRRS